MKIARRMIFREFFLACLWIGIFAASSELSAVEWRQQTAPVPRPTGMPSGDTWDPTAQSMKIVYDSRRHVTVGLGGNSYPLLPYLPVSEYNGTQWVSRYNGGAGNTPGNRTVSGAVFDSVRGVTMMIGGNEVWEYNGAAWTQRIWAGAGPALSDFEDMCFDPIRGRSVCLIRAAAAHTYETWEWTGTAWEQGPNLGGITNFGAKIIFDIGRNRAFVYGLGTSGVNEYVWEYTTGATAAQGVWYFNNTVYGAPIPGLIGVSLTYHPRLRCIFRIGGRTVDNLHGFLNYASVWDPVGSQWLLFRDSDFPIESARGGAGVCYDDIRGVIELYRGVRVGIDHDGIGYSVSHTDMWEWDDSNPADTWVDFSAIYTTRPDGSINKPYKSLNDALGRSAVGGTIYIKTGSSAETVTARLIFSATLRAVNGPVVIGRQ